MVVDAQRQRARRRLGSYAGLEQVGRCFTKVPPDAALDSDLFRSIVGLTALGRTDLADIERFKTNRYFQDALDLGAVPGADALREWLSTAGPDTRRRIDEWSARLLESHGAARGSGPADVRVAILAGSGQASHTHTVMVTCAGDAAWIVQIALVPAGSGIAATADEGLSTQLASDLDLDRPASGSLQMDETMLHVRMAAYNCLRVIGLPGVAARRPGTKPIWNDEVLAFFNENGYAIMPGVLSPGEVKDLRKILFTLADWERQHGEAFLYGGGDNLQRIYNLLNKHEAFRELIQRPLILEIMEDLFDRDTLHNKFLLCSWHANIIGGGGEAQILHVDSAVPEPLPPWIIRANVNFLLDDYTERNGATLCVPGSHKFLRKPTAADRNRSDLVKMTAPSGSLVIWTGHLWHQSGRNETNEPRIGLLGGFAASHLKEMVIEEDHLQIIDKEIVERASPALQRLIGVGHGIKKGALLKPPPW